MSPESNEQYRAGFEAWAREYGLDCDYVSGQSGDRYIHAETVVAFDAWTASKREASTEPSAAGALADQLAQARYTDYVQECDRRGLRPSSFYGFKVVCAEVEHAICVQVLIRCRHPASSSADDAKDAARWREVLSRVVFAPEGISGRFGMSYRAPTDWKRYSGDDARMFADTIDAAIEAKAGSDHG